MAINQVVRQQREDALNRYRDRLTSWSTRDDMCNSSDVKKKKTSCFSFFGYYFKLCFTLTWEASAKEQDYLSLVWSGEEEEIDDLWKIWSDFSVLTKSNYLVIERSRPNPISLILISINFWWLLMHHLCTTTLQGFSFVASRDDQ